MGVAHFEVSELKFNGIFHIPAAAQRNDKNFAVSVCVAATAAVHFSSHFSPAFPAFPSSRN